MNYKLAETLAEYGPWVVALVVPMLFLVWPWAPRPQEKMLLRLFNICVFGWIIIALIQWGYMHAWRAEVARQSNVADRYAPIGIATYALSGGVLTFFGSLPSMLIRGVIDVVYMKRRNQVVQQ